MMQGRSSTSHRQLLPGEAVMLEKAMKRRSTARILVGHTAWLTLHAVGEHEHVAFVKDISERGIFFYSDFGPSVGDEVYFVVEYLSGQNRVRFHLNGRVARVEQAGPDSAHGIAISFYSQRDEVPISPVVVRAI
jgi:Tfp pilus assembly protein PilZ